MRGLVLGVVALAIAAGCGRPPDESVSAPGVTRLEPAGAQASALRTYPRFGDSDPFDWQGRKPWSYPVHGIDVSRYQGTINWHQVRRFRCLLCLYQGDRRR